MYPNFIAHLPFLINTAYNYLGTDKNRFVMGIHSSVKPSALFVHNVQSCNVLACDIVNRTAVQNGSMGIFGRKRRSCDYGGVESFAQTSNLIEDCPEKSPLAKMVRYFHEEWISDVEERIRRMYDHLGVGQQPLHEIDSDEEFEAVINKLRTLRYAWFLALSLFDHGDPDPRTEALLDCALHEAEHEILGLPI